MSGILFLDVDGVLNSHGMPGSDSGLCIKRLRMLGRVVEQTRCRIIISSAWRYMGIGPMSVLFQCLVGAAAGSLGDQMLVGAIYKAVVGACPIEPAGCPVSRDQLIRDWIEANGEPQAFAVLDDLQCVGSFGDRAVICDPKVGLTWEKAEKLISLLGGCDG